MNRNICLLIYFVLRKYLNAISWNYFIKILVNYNLSKSAYKLFLTALIPGSPNQRHVRAKKVIL